MKTLGTLFVGGGLFDIGAGDAGYETIWGIEKDDRIASVARLNNLPVMTADVCDVDFSSLTRPNHIHASPPCPNFSIAKRGAAETEFDISMAKSICRALTTFVPDTFTLENVLGYKVSRSFEIIMNTLDDLGYFYDIEHLNAADFGVPQTRVRLFVRASKMLLRPYPQPVKWRGWFQAVEDLINQLPNAEFAPWQIARLPKVYKDFMIGQGTYSSPVYFEEPAHTITANSNQGGIKAFLLGGGNTNFADAKEGRGVRYIDEPAFTQMVSQTPGKMRTFVVSSGNSNREVTVLLENEPHYTVTASMDKTPSRAFIGRVVKMNLKALGRFQTVPDSYKGLTVRINGNGVPCLMAQKIMEMFL